MSTISHEMVADLKDMLGEEFGHFLETFTRDMNTRCVDIASAVQAQDSNAVRHATHSLKGSSSNLGADHLTDACADLEALSVTGSLEGASKIVEAIDQARTELLKELEKLA